MAEFGDFEKRMQSVQSSREKREKTMSEADIRHMLYEREKRKAAAITERNYERLQTVTGGIAAVLLSRGDEQDFSFYKQTESRRIFGKRIERSTRATGWVIDRSISVDTGSSERNPTVTYFQTGDALLTDGKLAHYSIPKGKDRAIADSSSVGQGPAPQTHRKVAANLETDDNGYYDEKYFVSAPSEDVFNRGVIKMGRYENMMNKLASFALDKNIDPSDFEIGDNALSRTEILAPDESSILVPFPTGVDSGHEVMVRFEGLVQSYLQQHRGYK